MAAVLTLDNFRQLCFQLAANADWNAQEPIPDFDTRYPDRLESCLSTPHQTFDGEELYPTLFDQLSILFYLLTKNHPFVNGNKRLALTALLVSLFMYGKWLSVQQDELYEFTMHVAGSEAALKDTTIAEIKAFLEGHTLDLRPTPPAGNESAE
jgi:death on curing protein